MLLVILCLQALTLSAMADEDHEEDHVVHGNQSIAAQNLCVLKHMLHTYTESDDVTLANMIELFDRVTTGYHDKAGANHLSAAVSEVQFKNPITCDFHVWQDANVYKYSFL